MFQFPGFPAYDYFIHHTLYGSSPYGFPHSDICGSQLICSSPQLFAACHVLRRLPMPRHSPCALSRLNSLRIFPIRSFSCLNCCVSHLQLLSFFTFFASGKIVLIYPPERPDFFKSRLFPLLLNFVCSCAVTHTLVCITPLLSYSVFNELSPAL